MTDAQQQLLYNIVSAVFGASTYISVQLLQKIKTKDEKKKQETDERNEHTKDMDDAASGLVKTSQEVIDMLKDMLAEQKIYFEEKIQEAKKDCQDQIDKLKIDNEETIKNLKADNESLKIRITNLDMENKDLQEKVRDLTKDKSQLQSNIAELIVRLSKYEDDIRVKSYKRSSKNK